MTADPDGSNSRGRKQNILDRNILRKDTRSSHDILILMFFTSLGQCKVNYKVESVEQWLRRKCLIF